MRAIQTILFLVVVAMVALVATQYPDIQRYMKMRSM
jgi:hypothetical protein